MRRTEMKITTFNPLIVTKDAKYMIALFEALGFEKRHTLNASVVTQDLTNVRMKDANGFYVDIAEIPETRLPQDLTLIRMNVDNFEEAYEFLLSKGFTNTRDGKTVDTKTNKSCMMRSPSGFAFDLCQHMKED
jgi:hypothetical protein